MNKTSFDKYIPTYNSSDACFYLDMKELPFGGEEVVIDRFIIILCIEGKLSIDIKGVTYEVGTNSLILCKPNDVINNCIMSTSCKCEIFTISNTLVNEAMTSVFQLDKFISLTQKPVIVVSDSYLPKFHVYKDLLTIKFNEEKSVLNKYIIKLIIRSTLYEIIQLAEAAISLDNQFITSRKEILFKDFIGILSNLSVKPRTVNWYADRLCVTPKYLSGICKIVSGKSALYWINNYVLKDVHHLLKTSDKSIKEISEHLQFPNTSFFGKYVKVHTGLTPKQYQIQIRSKVE